jgi:hypothetical protein
VSELAEAVAAVEARLDSIQTECNANTIALRHIQLPEPPDLTALADRVAVLEARPATAYDDTQLRARLDAIEALISAGHLGPAVDENGDYLTDAESGARLTI